MDPTKSHKSLPSNEQAELIRQLVRADVCILWKRDETSDWLDVFGWGGGQPDHSYINSIKLALKPFFSQFFETERSPLFLKNVSAPAASKVYMYQNEAIERGWKSLITTPLIRNNRVVGLIDTYWYRTIRKNEAVTFQETLKSISRLAVKALITPHETKPLAMLESFIPEFSKLSDDGNSLDEKLNIIVDMAKKMFNAKCGKLYWRIPDTRQLMLKYRIGSSRGLRDIGDSLNEGEGLVGRVVLLNEPQATPDYNSYEHRSERVHNDEAVMGVPIRRDGEPIGVLAVFNERENTFSEFEDVPLLSKLADLVSNIVREYEIIDGASKRNRDLEMVDRVIEDFNTQLETKPLLNNVAKLIKNHLKCSHCTVFLPGREGRRDFLEAAYAVGEYAKNIIGRKFYRDEPSLVWGVFERKHTEIFHDATLRVDFAPARSNRGNGRSLLIAPMMVEGRTVGMICADHDQRAFFKEDDLSIVDILAKHAGMAIERQTAVKIMEESSQLIVEKINQEKLETILEHVIDSARQLTQMDSGVIHIIKWEGDNPRIVVTRKSPKTAMYPPARTDDKGYPTGLTRKVADGGKPVMVEDTFHYPDIRPELWGVHQSCIGMPLHYGGVVIGALFIDDDRVHKFHAAELSRLQTLVNFAAAAIQNEQQFENQLRAIDEIAQVIAVPLDIKAVQEKILAWTNLLMDEASLSVLAMIDEEKNELSAYARSGLPVEDKYQRRLKLGEGVVGRVARTGESVLLNDVTADAQYKPLRDDISSELAVPIFIGGKVKGVLDINHVKKNAFTNVDLQQATAIAGLSGLAFTNAEIARKLFDQIVNTGQKRAIDLVTSDILHNVTNLVGTIPAWVDDIREILDNAATFEEKDEAYQLLDKIDRDIAVIESQANRSWPSSVSSSELDLASLAGDIIGELKAAFGAHIAFNFVYERPTSYVLKGVELNVREVIYNTLYNSVQAILKKDEKGRAGLIDVKLSRESEKIILMIMDNGVGISPEKRDHIFQLSTGFGVSKIEDLKYGLWRCRSILHDMGGDIKLVDTPLRAGSTFKITLNT